MFLVQCLLKNWNIVIPLVLMGVLTQVSEEHAQHYAWAPIDTTEKCSACVSVGVRVKPQPPPKKKLFKKIQPQIVYFW